VEKSFCGAEIQLGEWDKGKWDGGEWISVSDWHIMNGGTGDEQWYPKNQRIRWPVEFYVLNNTDEEWTDVVLTDHFGAELEIPDMEYELDGVTHEIEEIGVGNLNKEPDVDANGIGFYKSKGKSEQLRFIWDIGELPAGEDHTLTFYVATDLNPGQGKKDLPKWEFTSCGVHALNSGASLKWIDGDGMEQSESTDGWAVQICQPTPTVTTEIQLGDLAAPMIGDTAYILLDAEVTDIAMVESLEGIRGVNCDWYPAATGDITFWFSPDGGMSWQYWGDEFNSLSGGMATSAPIGFDTVGSYLFKAEFTSADTNYSDSQSPDDAEPLEVIDLQMEVTKTGDELSKIGDFVDYEVTVTNTSSGNVPPMTFYLGDPVAHINKAVVIPLGGTDVTNISDVEIPESADDPYANTVMVHATVEGLPYEIDGDATWETNLFQPSFWLGVGGDEEADVGDEISWTVTFGNTSSADAPSANVTITNQFTGDSYSFISSSGNTDTWTPTYTVQEGDCDINAPFEAYVSYDDFPNNWTLMVSWITVTNSPPEADFDIDNDYGAAVEDGGTVGHCDQPLNFSAYCTDPDDPGPLPLMSLTYEWDFGDGTIATGYHATHSYTYDGVYTTKLTVTDPCGATDSAIKTIEITNEDPTAHFVVTNLLDSYGMIPHCDQPVDFYNDSSDPDECDESDLYYEWDFGDGSPVEYGFGTMLLTSHTYSAIGSYTVVLTVWDNRGGVDSYSLDVLIGNENPTADFAITNVDGMTVSFYNGSDDNDECDNTGLTWFWDYDDGTSSTGFAPDHTYTSPGTYYITLTVSDDWGGVSWVEHSVTVPQAG